MLKGRTITAGSFVRNSTTNFNWTDGTFLINGGAFNNGGANLTINGGDSDDVPALRLASGATSVIANLPNLTIASSRQGAVVVSGVVVNEIELSWPRVLQPVDALLPNGYAVLDGHLLHDDQWDGYPAERARLVAAMQARGRAGGRSVILSGDVHSSWAFVGPCDAATGQPVAVEMTTPAVSSVMRSSHVPSARVPRKSAVRLFDRLCSGRKRPENGAEPDVIVDDAVSSNAVWM